MNNFETSFTTPPPKKNTSGQEALEAQLEKLQSAGRTLNVGGPGMSWHILGCPGGVFNGDKKIDVTLNMKISEGFLECFDITS